jgi:oxygen-independent coproporphyrinogen-3 oxidase
MELQDIAALAQRLRLRLRTLYIGGGTPTAIPAAQLRLLMETVATCFDVTALEEYTVEAGRPDCTTAEKLNIIKELGATRISINPQTLSDEVLRAIGRRHTAQDILDCFAQARQAGHNNINMDLIAGLPLDTPGGFAQSLQGVMALQPENITVHTLTLKRASTLVEDAAPDLYGDVAQMLTHCAALPKAGYVPYYMYRQKGTLQNLENIGYTKPGFDGLYNIFIMEEVHTILSAGAGGSTKLVAPDGRIQRIFNHKYPLEYLRCYDVVQQRKKGIEEFYGQYVDLDPQALG